MLLDLIQCFPPINLNRLKCFLDKQDGQRPWGNTSNERNIIVKWTIASYAFQIGFKLKMVMSRDKWKQLLLSLVLLLFIACNLFLSIFKGHHAGPVGTICPS